MAMSQHLFSGVTKEKFAAAGFMDELVSVGEFHQVHAIVRPVARAHLIMAFPLLGDMVINVQRDFNQSARWAI